MAQSWEAQDALGETHMMIGEKDFAAQSFKESPVSKEAGR
jgi:hypothetical protein